MRHATFPALPDEADGLYLPGVLARAAGSNGSAGPYVRDEDRVVPIRDWLCDAMTPPEDGPAGRSNDPNSPRGPRKRAVLKLVK